MKTWFNEGDEFIKKYENLKYLKEKRDNKKHELNEIKMNKPDKVTVNRGMFSSKKDIKLNYDTKRKVQEVIVEQLQKEIKKINKQMIKVKKGICNE